MIPKLLNQLTLIGLIFFCSVLFVNAQEAETVISEEPKKDLVESEIFKVVEVMPRFPGCEEVEDKMERKSCSQKKMLEFIYENVKYPEAARAKSTEGTVIVRFIIDTNGMIQEPSLIRNIGDGCGEEAMRVVGLMNEMPEKWIPGLQRGKPVDVYFNLPIKFRLEKSKTTKEKKIKK